MNDGKFLYLIYDNYLSQIDDLVYKVVSKLDNDDPAVIYSDDIFLFLIHDIADDLLQFVMANIDTKNIENLFGKFKSHIINNQSIKNELIKIGYMLILYSCYSKYLLSNIRTSIKIGIVVPVYNEIKTMNKYSKKNKNGQNALQAKIYQYKWLFKNNNIKTTLLFIDDFGKENLGESIINWLNSNKIVKKESNMEIEVINMSEITKEYSSYDSKIIDKLHKNGCNSIKGGSVLYGLEYLTNQGYQYGAYYDFDMTHSIAHIGIMAKRITENKKCGVVINSRRRDDSFGYYYNGKANMGTTLFQALNRELIGVDTTDINVGCKMINLKYFKDIINECDDFGLSFDSEIIILMKKHGYTIEEVAGCSMHKYIKGKFGVPRNYGDMIESTHNELVKQGILLSNKRKRLYNLMYEYGGYDNMVTTLEKFKKSNESNNEAIERFCIEKKAKD